MHRDVSAQVHRFGDSVAIYLGGETRYLSARDARKVSAAINRACRDVERVPRFSESQCGTFSATFPDGRNREFSQ